MKSIVAASVLVLSTLSSNAELVNISATAAFSGSQRAVACSIIDTGTIPIAGGVMLFIFAESDGASDASIRAWSLQRDLAVTNENWQAGFDMHGNGRTVHVALRDLDERNGNPYGTLLRSPARPSDAAVVFPALLGEAVCVESYDRSGAPAPVNVSISITDLNAIAFKSAQLKAKSLPLGTDELTPRALEELSSKLPE
ncbi:hypothetical protein [Acidovorax sp. MR-S7]|uniref:hypothetical protein n=1 Tax=Acidovorax sp. MR-S7 TaxID=1268622 RepID=UPI0003D3EC3C|nr:hypothetical protein [Acidovorax sp. MR-S7]GAD20924.1 hypothetical protein AVS7_00685 [Acidovorax sp. MR-S7]